MRYINSRFTYLLTYGPWAQRPLELDASLIIWFRSVLSNAALSGLPLYPSRSVWRVYFITSVHNTKSNLLFFLSLMPRNYVTSSETVIAKN